MHIKRMVFIALLAAASISFAQQTGGGGVPGANSSISAAYISTASTKYGAIPDARTLADGAITSGTAILTNASGAYASGDVGKTIVVNGAGASTSSTTLTSALSTGSPITTIAVSALPAAVPAGWVILTSGSNTQNFTTGGANSGATSITVDSVTPNFAYPIGTAVVTPPLPLVTTIASQQSATQVTLTANASNTVAANQLGSVTGVSGVTFSGSGYVNLSNFNNGCTSSTAVVNLISGVFANSTLGVQGTGCTAAPTTATCTSGTATCTGSPVTINVATTLAGAETVYGTNNYTGLNSAIADAISSGLPLFIAPSGTTGEGYLYNGTLTLASNVNITGAGFARLLGPLSNGNQNNNNYPVIAPYLQGSVLIEAGQAIDAMQITKSPFNGAFRDFGIRFAGKWVPNATGHGIDVVPPVQGAFQDNGVMYSEWQNLYVYGQDGNHYGYNFVNPLYDTLINIGAAGGGLINLEGNGLIEYGNTVLIHPVGMLIMPGSAFGIRAWSTTQYFNKITLIRPQINATIIPVITNTPLARSVQTQFSTSGTNAPLQGISVYMGDFEGNTGAVASFPTAGTSNESFGTVAGNSVPTNSPTSGTCYQNTAAAMAAVSITYALAPTGSAAATVTIATAGSSSSCASPSIVDEISSPISGPAITGTVKAYIYPGNYFVVTYTNATRVAGASILVPSA